MNKPKKVNPLLAGLFKHSLSPDPAVRTAACTALGACKRDESVVSCLLSALSDDSSAVRMASRAALNNLRLQPQLGTFAPEDDVKRDRALISAINTALFSSKQYI